MPETSDHRVNICEQEIVTVKVIEAAKKSIENTGFIALIAYGCDKDRWMWVGAAEISI